VNFPQANVASAELFMNGKQKSSAASRESNFQIEFKLCGKAAWGKRHVSEINLVSCLLFLFLCESYTIDR
jgi:hypothetical protein